jgi:hypothetical protein
MFELQQGIESPRDGTLNWMSYETYDTLAAAKKEARKNKGRWRIVEQAVVWDNQIDK